VGQEQPQESHDDKDCSQSRLHCRRARHSQPRYASPPPPSRASGCCSTLPVVLPVVSWSWWSRMRVLPRSRTVGRIVRHVRGTHYDRSGTPPPIFHVRFAHE
jgi:hypothetical protein